MRRRYDFLFGLILNSGLRITEALGVRVRDVRVADGIAKSVRVIGKGNRERLVPLPKDFGQVFGFWLSDKGRDDFVFAKEPGGKAPGPHDRIGQPRGHVAPRSSERTGRGVRDALRAVGEGAGSD